MRVSQTRLYGVSCPLPIEVSDRGCWEWQGTINDSGYGVFVLDGKRRRAHRWVYELQVGPIPQGLDIDHLCRVRHCVNPTHLEPVTRRENLLRGDTTPARLAAQTHCKRGHEFTPENTYIWSGSPTTRTCRECKNSARSRARGAA